MFDAANWAVGRPRRHCEPAKPARQSIFLAAERLLDCFVASLLAMTVKRVASVGRDERCALRCFRAFDRKAAGYATLSRPTIMTIARVPIFPPTERKMDCFVASLLAMTVDGLMDVKFGIRNA